MKKETFNALTILSLFAIIAAAPVYAQHMGNNAVKIPFEFVAGNKTLPAGEYSIKPISADAPAVLSIESLDGSLKATVSTHAVQTGNMQAETKLIFNRYGRQYFLSRIWSPGSDRGRELFKSSVELELAKSGVEQEIVTINCRQFGSSRKKDSKTGPKL